MNPAAILTLISSLMEQILTLQNRVTQLESEQAKPKT